MEIVRATIHQLNKKAKTMQAEVPQPIVDAALLEQNSILTEFVEELRASFAKGSPTYGCFETSSATYPVEGFFQNYWNCKSDENFKQITANATKHLHQIIKQNFNAIADYIIYVHYRESNSDFLFSVILNNMRGFKLNAQNQLEASPQLDESNLHHAVRINITKWQASKLNISEQQKYLCFISKKESKVQGSQYFRTFIGATDFADSAANTTLLKTVIEEAVIECYPDVAEPFEKIQEKLTNAHAILTNHLKEKGNTPITIQEIANHVFPDCPEKLVEIAMRRELSGELVINKGKLNSYKKIKIHSPKLSISFDRTLLNDIVVWDKKNKKLEIDLTNFNITDLESLDNEKNADSENN